MKTPETIRREVDKRLKERGITYKRAAMIVGHENNPTYIQQYVRYAKPLVLGEDERTLLAPEIGLAPDDLRVDRKKDSTTPGDGINVTAANAPNNKPEEEGAPRMPHEQLEIVHLYEKLDASRRVKLLQVAVALVFEIEQPPDFNGRRRA